MIKPRFSSVTISIGMLVAIIIVGEVGYVLIENYNFLDALFMTIITVSTVGFGEIKPLSPMGKLFSIFMIVFSFGAFAYAVTSITRFMVDGGFRNFFGNKRNKRQIRKLKNHVILCGYGRNGSEAARTLQSRGIPFLIIENSPEVLEEIRVTERYLFVQGDASDDFTLKIAQINNAKSLITTLPSDADNVLVVLSARSLNSDIQIISRASHEWSDLKMKTAGANNVIMPDMVGGRRMAKIVASPDIVSFLGYMRQKTEGESQLTELSCTDFSCSFLNKNIGELRFKKISGVNIIGMKTSKGEYIFNPPGDMRLDSSYKLFVMGTKKQIAKLKAAVSSSE